MEKKTELKMCPFCGTDVQRVIGFMGVNFFKCTECGATVSFDNEYYNNHKNEALKAWNRRSDND